MSFARAGRRFIQPRPVKIFGEPIQLVEPTRYLGVTLDKLLIWLPYIDQVSMRTVQKDAIAGSSPQQEDCTLRKKWVNAVKGAHSQMMDNACPD
jgi:hypothetical protein